MGKGRIVVGILVFAILGAAIGYVLATGYITLMRGGSAAAVDFTLLARLYSSLDTTAPEQLRVVNLLMGGGALAGLLLSAVLMNEALTKFGTTHWQTRAEMKSNGFFLPNRAPASFLENTGSRKATVP